MNSRQAYLRHIFTGKLAWKSRPPHHGQFCCIQDLQKLEALGLLEKTRYGEYMVKEKRSIKGHLWIGRSLVPRLIFYAFFFAGILSAEIAIITIRLFVGEPLQMDFIFLIFITIVALGLFLFEGILLFLRVRHE